MLTNVWQHTYMKRVCYCKKKEKKLQQFMAYSFMLDIWGALYEKIIMSYSYLKKTKKDLCKYSVSASRSV